MKANKSFTFMAVLALAALAGCVGRARAPEVTLSSVGVAGIGLRGATLIANLDIKNPNDFTLETDSVVYLFDAADPASGSTYSSVTRGTYAQRVQIKDGETKAVEVPIEFSYSNMGAAVRAILNKGTFNYRLTGNVFLREPLRRTIPFSKTGNVSLQGAR